MNDDLHVQIDFTEPYSQDPEAVRDLISDAEQQLPVVINSASARHSAREIPGKQGIEWLPLLDIVLAGPAVLLLIREMRKVVEAKLKTSSNIVIRITRPDGAKRELTVKSSELDGAETKAMISEFAKI